MTFSSIQRRFRVNHQIRVPEVRLIDENDKQIGIVSLQDAIREARERGLDLVEVSPVAQPPVCRIVDFGKFTYQLERQERKNKAKQKKVELKSIRLSLTIGDHDLDVRREQALKFLQDGNKVKIELIMRGRENQHRDRARTLMEEFVKDFGNPVKTEGAVTLQGNRFNVIISL